MIKRLPWLCVLCVPLVAGCLKSKWKDYQSPEGRFSCKMPDKPEEKETRVTLPGAGQLTLHTHFTEIRKGAFGVNWFDIPRGQPYDLDMGIKGAAHMLKGTVQKRQPCNVNGLKGVQFQISITFPKKGYASGRVFVVKNRVYQVLVIGTETEVETEDVVEFLDSFRLTS